MIKFPKIDKVTRQDKVTPVYGTQRIARRHQALHRLMPGKSEHHPRRSNLDEPQSGCLKRTAKGLVAKRRYCLGTRVKRDRTCHTAIESKEDTWHRSTLGFILKRVLEINWFVRGFKK